MSRRVDVLGLHVSATNLDLATEQIDSWINNGQPEYVCVTGVHGTMESQQNPELLEIHNKAGLVTPDGMPLVWCCRMAGAKWVDRVYGPDLMLRLCEESVAKGWSHFFYGAGEGVAEQLARNLSLRYPGLKVAGVLSPPFRELDSHEVEEIARTLNTSGADVVWVGLSTPKQEQWMSAFRPRLEAPVLIGVGAAFDIHAGTLRQAPRWVQRSGMEWFFRLMMEPRRLWRRYLRSNPRFLWSIAFKRPQLILHETSDRHT